MHLESQILMRWLLESLAPKSGICCLDIGSKDHNGSYRELAEGLGLNYQGADLEAGPNVDHVLTENGDWKTEVGSRYQLVLSGQCLEHVRRPWQWIKQAAGLLSGRGILIVIVPHTCPHHGYPLDCWRVFPDGLKVLFDEAGLKTLLVGLTTYENAYKSGDTFGIAAANPKKTLNFNLRKIKNLKPRVHYECAR